jgi:hypothetical protein
VVEVAPRDLERLIAMMGDDAHLLGVVTEDDELVLPGVRPLDVSELADAFNRIIVPEGVA